MTFDFFGPWEKVANHNAPLYPTTVGDANYNIQSAFYMLTQTYRVPASKINLGAAFYGRSQTGATALNQPTSGQADNSIFAADQGAPHYYNILTKMPLFDEFWDTTAKVPYLLGKANGPAAGIFVSFDNTKSMAIKAQFIKNNNARGIIIWEITGDYIETSSGSGIIASTPLIDTLNHIFCNSDIHSNEE